MKDDGRGFDLDTILNSGASVGMAGMFERAEILGGRLTVRSTPGSGAELTMEVPIDKE